MAVHLYLSTIPEALIASMLTPIDFGVYYAVGMEKKSRGQAQYLQRGQGILQRLLPHGGDRHPLRPAPQRRAEALGVPVRLPGAGARSAERDRQPLPRHAGRPGAGDPAVKGAAEVPEGVPPVPGDLPGRPARREQPRSAGVLRLHDGLQAQHPRAQDLLRRAEPRGARGKPRNGERARPSVPQHRAPALVHHGAEERTRTRGPRPWTAWPRSISPTAWSRTGSSSASARACSTTRCRRNASCRPRTTCGGDQRRAEQRSESGGPTRRRPPVFWRGAHARRAGPLRRGEDGTEPSRRGRCSRNGHSADVLEPLRPGRVASWSGTKGAEFEDPLGGVGGAPHAVSCSSGTAALHMALLALGHPARGRGDRALPHVRLHVARRPACRRGARFLRRGRGPDHGPARASRRWSRPAPAR